MDGLVDGVQFPYNVIFKKGLNIPSYVRIERDIMEKVERATNVLSTTTIYRQNSWTVILIEFADGEIWTLVDMDNVTKLTVKNAKYRSVKSKRKEQELIIRNDKNKAINSTDRTRMYG